VNKSGYEYGKQLMRLAMHQKNHNLTYLTDSISKSNKKAGQEYDHPDSPSAKNVEMS